MSELRAERSATPYPRALLPEAGLRTSPIRRDASIFSARGATDADVIAFCGVRFRPNRQELSPQKTVILPDSTPDAPRGFMPADQFKAFREAHPDHIA